MDEHGHETTEPESIPPHAGLRYALFRVLLMLVVGGVLYLIGMRTWPWLFATVLVSAALSFFVLKRQREAAARSLEASVSAGLPGASDPEGPADPGQIPTQLPHADRTTVEGTPGDPALTAATSGAVGGSESGVRVQAVCEEVHAEVVDQEAGEPDQPERGRLASSPAGGRAGVQVAGVDDPGDEGPGLLGVPAPVAAPGVLGPDRAGDDGEGPQREDERVDPVGQAVEGRGVGRAAAIQAPTPARSGFRSARSATR